MRMYALLALALFLGGCNQAPYVVKDGGTAEQLNADRFDCKHKAITMQGGFSQMDPGSAIFAAGDFHDCMQSKGYRQAPHSQPAHTQTALESPAVRP